MTDTEKIHKLAEEAHNYARAVLPETVTETSDEFRTALWRYALERGEGILYDTLVLKDNGPIEVTK